jgi:hypothetical protein
MIPAVLLIVLLPGLRVTQDFLPGPKIENPQDFIIKVETLYACCHADRLSAAEH